MLNIFLVRLFKKVNVMKKRIISFILASTSTVAFADVNLYGRVAVGLENDQFQNTDTPGGGNIQDFGSYFGIRGNDPIYGQTSAIWQVEQFLDITSGQAYYSTTAYGRISPNPSNPSNTGHINNEVNTLASGESYLGMQGGWGRIRLGNISNYMRQQMGAVDVYNYANGVDGLGNYSRTSRLLPTSIAYNSPIWNGFSLAGVYSYQNNGQNGVSGVNVGNNFGGSLNGVYSGGIYSLGLGWDKGPFSVRLGTQVYQQVGTYTDGTTGMDNGTGGQNAAYPNAYQNRLELGYDDGEDLIVGIGFQITNGLGWSSWANSGGSYNNFIYNGTAPEGLNSNQYQTQETALTLGWHLGPWTPKVSYVYGNNMMYGGDMWTVATGSASQIADSGYQQAVAELDWNVTPKTIVFINYGQIWYGQTLQNVAYCGTSCSTAGTTVNGSNQSAQNQSSAAIGFTHTF